MTDNLSHFYDHELLLNVEKTPEIERKINNEYDLVVASLADPYNGPLLWQSLSKFVRVGGYVFLTTPSYEWSRSFRKMHQGGRFDVADIESAGGTSSSFRSIILPADKQISLCRSHGFRIEILEQMYCDQIPASELSSKLYFVNRNQLPAITGYVLIRESAGFSN